MIIKFNHAFATSTGLVYLAGQVAAVSDEDGYRAVAAKAGLPGRRLTVKNEGTLVDGRPYAAGDVVDFGVFDTSIPVKPRFHPTTRIVVQSPVLIGGREAAKGDTVDVQAEKAPALVEQGVAKFADACTHTIA